MSTSSGLIFGIFSMIQAALAPTGPTDVWFTNPLLSILPRLFIGPIAWLVFSSLKRWLIPSLFAAQGYDSALLMNAVIGAVGGDLSDKDKLRDALRKADFNSVRGKFRFNNNHFPIQNFYIRQVIKNDDGVLTNKLLGIAFEDHADAYASECPMQW